MQYCISDHLTGLYYQLLIHSLQQQVLAMFGLKHLAQVHHVNSGGRGWLGGGGGGVTCIVGKSWRPGLTLQRV